MPSSPCLSYTLSSAAWRLRECQGKDRRVRRWIPATVPGCVHLDLHSAGLIPDPYVGTNELDVQWIEERDWEYECRFRVPTAMLGRDRLDWVADGLDTVATVTLNGQVIAETSNMFVEHRRDVRNLLRAGTNTLHVRFRSAMVAIREADPAFTPPQEFNDPVGGCVRLRKQQCQFGWDWGPRLVTAGIWRDMRIEAGNRARLDSVRVRQEHRPDGTVRLSIDPEVVGGTAARVVVSLGLDGRLVHEGESTGFDVPSPRLWWPAGQGDQPLYSLTVTAFDAAGTSLGSWTRRIGLRTLVLEQLPDAWGTSFRFVVNGRPVFMKGANWIPADCFVARLGRAEVERDLRAAVQANMNAVRVWGGGIYESDAFYDVCDELGLLVWQDFLFACTLYPADDAFVASVREEARCAIRRLRHRASLALWCGNNELVQINGKALRTDATLRAGYERLFHETLPAVLAEHDGVTSYHPGSEWRGTFENGHSLGEISGDTHYWDVWHARHPVRDYERWAFRFCSEFGMQSWSSPQTNATFAPRDANVFGPVMENHQKNRGGNQVILDYVSRRYRFPKSQGDLIYLSQLNQAHCMRVGVEHFRRLMPRCMGAIYWQLNDCWPVASWSSIEHGGRWKLLHFAARRFFAPSLASVRLPGEDGVIIGNYRRSTIDAAELFTVHDAPSPARGVLRWDVFHLSGAVLLSGSKPVRLRAGESVLQRRLDLRRLIEAHGRDHVVLRVALDVGDATVSEQAVFLAEPRFLDLPKARARLSLRMRSPTEATLTVRSRHFQHALWFDFGDHAFAADDNGFDLFPDEPRTVTVTFPKPVSAARARASLSWRSLADTTA